MRSVQGVISILGGRMWFGGERERESVKKQKKRKCGRREGAEIDRYKRDKKREK